jgi:hypothetical protein
MRLAAAKKWKSKWGVRMTDHNWIPVSVRMPNDSQLVALRMMESIHKDVHYAIGWYSEEQCNWVITAHPKTDAYLEVIAWVALPD